MLKLCIGLLIGICLTSIPVYKLQEKLEQREQVLLSILWYKGIALNGTVHTCRLENTYTKLNEGLDYVRVGH